MTTKTSHLTVSVLVIFWLSFLIYQGCNQTQLSETNIQESTLVSTFIGDKKCKTCHQEEYSDWLGSHHEKAMLHATDTSVLADFNNTTFETNGYTSTFFKKGDEFYVKIKVPLDTDEEFKIAYTFGWSPLQQYLIEFPDGKLQAFHIAWNTEKNQWFDLYPNDNFEKGDWMHWSRGSMTWNKMCADCHSTNLQKNYSEETGVYATSWTGINVSCEACHGPGSAHADYIDSKEYQKGAFSYIKQVSTDPSITQIESCAPCHSRRSALGSDDLYSGRFLDHYTPDLLRSNLYHPDGQILEEDYVYGSFLQSKMYQNGVKCTDCHNPHTSELKQKGNALCTNCHTQVYNRIEHTFHPEGTESSLCISCHMPGRTYMGNDFRRDHSFRVPRPDQSVLYDTPNACVQCHLDKTNDWASSAIARWYGPNRAYHYSDILIKRNEPNSGAEFISLAKDLREPGIVRATAIDHLANIPTGDAYQAVLLALNDHDALVRVAALQNLIQLPKEDRIRFSSPLLGDPIRSVRVTAALVLGELKLTDIPIRYQDVYAKAYDELMTKLKHNIDFSTGQLQMAQLYDRKGETEKAIQAYQLTLVKDSLLQGVRINLARLYSLNGKNEDAIQVLEDALKINSQNPQALYSLGLVYAEENRENDAALIFARAAKVSPLDLRIYYNWGLILHQMTRSDEAIDVFRKALSINTNADDIRYALITVLMAIDKKDFALKEARILESKYPQNREIAAMVKQLEGTD
jgi:predicted CXXCH cytochrome family protein